MALETKRITVNPDDESVVIDNLRAFGWDLKGRNEVMNSTEHFDGAYSFRGAGTVFTHTEVNHFVSLLFERDREMPHYEELCTQEAIYMDAVSEANSYSQAMDNVMQEDHEKIDYAQQQLSSSNKWALSIWVGVACFVAYFLISIVVSAINNDGLMWGVMTPAIVLGIIFIISGVMAKNRNANPQQQKDKIAKIEEEISAIQRKYDDYLENARSAITTGNKLLDENKEESKKEIAAPKEDAEAEKRLSDLSRLHDEKLISDEEYEAKRKDILDEL